MNHIESPERTLNIKFCSCYEIRSILISIERLYPYLPCLSGLSIRPSYLLIRPYILDQIIKLIWSLPWRVAAQ